MTKDRARKQAARERAALTGERYVVAARAVAEPSLDEALPQRGYGRMHDLTHRVPGVPPHIEGGLQASRAKGRNTPHSSRQNPVHKEPRVLVAWQNWIARRVGVGTGTGTGTGTK
ncbi:MAG: hypothetical protein JWN36_856 [Microbacteriaceae bacterium]|nr:hypothetical protein [Microbacteriaceae bacterium]